MWWLAPLLVTAVCCGWCAHLTRHTQSGGRHPLEALWGTATWLAFGVVPSLVAWLVWAVLR